MGGVGRPVRREHYQNTRFLISKLTHLQVKDRRPARDWQCFWENNVRPIFLKRQPKELKNAHTTTTGVESQLPCAEGREIFSNRISSPSRRRTSADSAARRSPSLEHESLKGYTKSPSLPIRSPSKLYKKPGPGISQLESLETDAGDGFQLPPAVSLKAMHRANDSETYPRDAEGRLTSMGKDAIGRDMMEPVLSEFHAERTTKVLEARLDVGAEDQYSRPLPQHSPESAGYRRLPRSALGKARETSPSPLAPPLALAATPKRKRDVADDDDLPSSSPPGLPLPRSASPKRQKRGHLQAKPLEIASTPENSPRRPDLDAELQLTGRTDDAILNPDDSESGAESSESDDNAIFDDCLLGRPASPTLSSPSRTIPNTQPSPRRSTQAVFNDPTQFIDLEIPDPEGGWDEDVETPLSPEELDPNSQLVDSPPAIVIPETQADLPDTQALLDSRTQMPDFSIAEPDGGWDSLDLIPSSPPPMPGQHSSPPPPPTKAPSPDPKKLRAGLYTWIEIQITAGFPLENLIAALKATSNNLELAKLVLKYMTRKGRGRIPSNEKGIWTEDDDEDLESTDARRIEKVQAKHGAAVCDVRLAFLHVYRQSEKTT